VDHTGSMTAGEYNEFDFLINLSSLTGNSGIESDFLKSLGGEGGVILNAAFDYGHKTGPGNSVVNYYYNNGATTTSAQLTSGTFTANGTYQGFQGDWNQSFANPLTAGVADTFVPEPAMYSAAASMAALAGVIFIRRRSDNLGRPGCAAKKA
jgi:hypothetical protein